MRLRGNDGSERLLSALEQPRWSRYHSLSEKAAALHFFLNKGHPFVDGNKRFAVAATDTFLCINNADFVGTDSEVVNLARGVADASISLQMLSAFFRQRVQRNSWSDEQTERWVGNLQEALGSVWIHSLRCSREPSPAEVASTWAFDGSSACWGSAGKQDQEPDRGCRRWTSTPKLHLSRFVHTCDEGDE